VQLGPKKTMQSLIMMFLEKAPFVGATLNNELTKE
jgi:hypothetical protein